MISNKPSSPPFVTLIEKIGSGAFSQVWKAKMEDVGEDIVVKILSKFRNFDGCTMKRVLNEIEIHMNLEHSNICTFFSMNENMMNYFLIMEYLPNGNLLERCLNNNLSCDDIKKYFIQIYEALKFLHANNICHHDLKLQNIMLDEDDNIKLIDFGLSAKFNNDGVIDGHRAGSLKYAAPELFEKKHHTKSIDIWSLGVILFRMVCGYFPFDYDCRIVRSNGFPEEEPNYPPDLNTDILELLRGMLMRDPERRWKLEMIENCNWLKDDIPLYKERYGICDKISDRIRCIKESVLKPRRKPGSPTRMRRGNSRGGSDDDFSIPVIPRKEAALTPGKNIPHSRFFRRSQPILITDV